MTARVCRVCSCTESDPCFTDDHGAVHRLEGLKVYSDQDIDGMTLVPCHWIETDLCSACVQPPAPPPLLYDAYGNPLRGAP